MLNSEPGGLASVDIRVPDGVQTLSVPHKCLRCEGPVRSAPRAMQCVACGAEWPVQDGVPFYSSAEYFGEVSQAEMKTLIQLASQTNWRTAIRTRFKESNPELYRYDLDLGDIAELWRRGSVIASWLLDLTAAALAKDPALTNFAGKVSDSGEGRWTIKAAIDEAVPAPVLTTALYQRFNSRGEADFQNKLLSAMRYQFGGHHEKPPEK